MNPSSLSPRRVRLGSASAWTIPVLCLLISGCRSIEQGTPQQPAGAPAAQVLSTNPVPLQIEDQHVLLQASLNGHEVRLLLDTGASHVLLTPEAAAAAGIQKTATLHVGAFGNEQGTAGLGIAASVAVGPALAEKVPVAILPVPPVFDADGFLGLSFLRQFAFRLDYERKLLSLASPASNTLTAAGASLSLLEAGPLLALQAQVDGTPARLLLDTGAGQGLILHSWFVEEHKLRQRYPQRLNVVTGGGLLGQMRGEIVRLHTLKLGDYTMTNLFVEFAPKTKTRHGNIAGVLGAAILSRFNLTFDLAARRLFLEPNAAHTTEPPPPASVRSGLVCLPSGTNCIVLDVIPGSPAAATGVRLGDHVLEINGVSVSSLKFAEIKRAFQAAPGTQVRLRLQTDGAAPREVILTLRDLL